MLPTGPLKRKGPNMTWLIRLAQKDFFVVRRAEAEMKDQELTQSVRQYRSKRLISCALHGKRKGTKLQLLSSNIYKTLQCYEHDIAGA
jgi:hypothetical protein